MKLFVTSTLLGLMLSGVGYAQTSAGAGASQAASVSANQSGAKADSSTRANQSARISKGEPPVAANQVQSGSMVHATLTKPVDARKNKPGDEVVAKSTEDVKSNGQVVIPRGSKIVGHVTEAKARTKGQKDSSLGLQFDHAVLKNGTMVPVSFAVQAISSAAVAQAPQDSLMSSGDAGMAGESSMRSSGGVIGGAGATAGAITNTAVGATGSLGSAGGVTSAPLTTRSQGVVGIPNLTLASEATNSTTSTITSNASNVHLDSGTEMILRANP